MKLNKNEDGCGVIAAGDQKCWQHAWKVVKFSRDLEVMIVKGDAPKIIPTLHKERHYWSRYGQLLEDTKTVLNSFQS